MANRVVRGLAWTTASSVARNLCQFFQIAILTRFLDKSDFGIIAIAQVFVSFTSIFMDMGISVGIVHRQNISKNEYSSLFWLNILAGLILSFVLFLFSPLLTSKYNSDDLTSIVRIMCFTIMLNSIGIQQRTYCQKMTYFNRIAIIEILGSFVTISVAIFTAMVGYGVYSLAYSTLAGALLINLTHLSIGLIKDGRIKFHFSIYEIVPFLRIGMYKVGSSILDFLTRELDIIIISATLGMEFLGVYNIAKKVPASIYSFINPIVHSVFSPLLAEKQGNMNVLKSNYMQLSKSLSFISFPMYFFLAAVSPTVISYVFGVSYLDGVPVMIFFCLKYAFNGVNGVCSALQTATGRTDIGLTWTIYLITSTIFVYWFTAQFGIFVFLIGIGVMVFINAIVCWFIQFRQMVGVTFREYMTIYYRSFLICLLLSCMVYCVYRSPSLVFSLCAGITYIIIYIISIMKTKDGIDFLIILEKLKVSSSFLVFLGRMV